MPYRDALWYCDFCNKSQDEVISIVVQQELDRETAICDECGDIIGEILVEKREGVDIVTKLNRAIEFPPEYQQAGLSILNYFARVMYQKYPDTPVKVRIEQEGLVVRMMVETSEGSVEILERALEEYGLVVLGKMAPEEYLSDPLDVLALKNKLEIAAMELRHNRELLSTTRELGSERIGSLEKQVAELKSLLGSGLESVRELVPAIVALANQNRDNERVSSALDRIAHSLARGVSAQDGDAITRQLIVLKDEQPGVLSELKDIFKGSVSGAAGTFLHQWLLPIINSLPK